MTSLVTSSIMTLSWLNRIKSEIERKIPSVTYGEGKYWAYFKSSQTWRNVAYLQPQKSQIRLFTRLDPSYDEDLQVTPSTSFWAKMYPSLFKIKSADMLGKAIKLIVTSCEYDRSISDKT